MLDWMFIWAVLLALAGGATLVYWSVALERLLRTRRVLPTARDGVALAAADGVKPRVCVIVPAYNEAAVIGRLAATLKAQDYPALHIVFALDRCTDDTEGVIRRAFGDDARLEVMNIRSCPPEWAGKCHALHHAVHHSEAARGAELILFADADTTFEPRCISACVALLRQRGLGMLSLLSTLESRTWYEWLLQPPASVEVLRQYPPLKANDPVKTRAMANGQFMLFRREAYEAIGGHENVSNEVLEDMALAMYVADAGYRPGVLLADGMLHCRMYPSFKAFCTGWRRIYLELSNRKPGRLRRAALQAVVFRSFLPLVCSVGGVAAVWWGLAADNWLRWAAGTLALAGASAWAATLLLAARFGRSSALSALLSPIGTLMIAWLQLEAARDLTQARPVRWGGKEYVRPARYQGGEGIRSYRTLVEMGKARMAPGRS